jgi:hypothetical protein
MLNLKKMIPSLSGMISPNLVDKITSMLFDDINDADDGTLIVYFVAEFMKSFYKPYCESLDLDDIAKRNFYFDFYNNELLNFLVDYDDSEYISVEFKKGAIILSDYYTNTELLNSALKNTATVICKKYRDEKSEDEWDECFHRRYATAFRAFLFNLEDEVHEIFKEELKGAILKYLSDLKILLENYSSNAVNKGIDYNNLNLADSYLNFVIDKKLDSNLFKLIEKNFDNEQLYVLFNPEIIGLDFVLRKVCLDYKEIKEDFNRNLYIKKYIVFLLDKVCSLKELISSVPKLDGEDILFSLVSGDGVSKFVSNSKPENMQFFVDTVRNLLLSVKDLNLEELATRKIVDCDDESGLSVLLHNLSIAMSEYGNSDINYKIVEDLFIDNTLSKSNIDQLVRAFSKIQLLIWQNKVLYPEIVAEKYELSILGLNTSLKFAENTDGINKDVYDYFIGKFFRTVDSTYLKSLNLGIRTIVYKMILDVDDNEIAVSLKSLINLCSKPKEKNLLNSTTFIPRNKKIVLYDLPELSFDDNTIFALSRICKYFNIVDENSNVDTNMVVCYDKNESKSWGLLFDCIDGGHLDFNNHIEEARLSMKILNISPN